MKNILILFCMLAFAPAVFAGGTMIYTTPQDATGQNNWYGKSNTTFYSEDPYVQTMKTQNLREQNQTTVTNESSYEKRYKAGHESTFRTRQDKYYNHGGVKFGTGFSNNGSTGRW